jgi:hypothetical protein
MSAFIRKEDLDTYRAHADEIAIEVEKVRLATLEPTKDAIEGARAVIYDFIRRKKRKLYGGQAQNLLLKAKNPKDAIYKDLEYKDIEFYSPDPIRDDMELCDELHAKGFKNVKSSEAQHEETYKIFVDFLETCDICYCPRNIYNRIPYEEIDGLWLVSPSWMMVNTLRVITDMLSSGYRLEKDLSRGYLMQKHYPMKPVKHEPKHEKPAKETEQLRAGVLDWCNGKESIIQVGELGCEYYKKLKIPNVSELRRIDVISTNFAADCYDMYHYLAKLKDVSKDKLVSLEYYPFLDYTGHRFTIWYDNKPVVQIFSYNKRCTPYRDIKYGKSFLRIGTFSLVLMYNYLLFHMARVNREEQEELQWRWQIQTVIDARNKYLTEKKKTAHDETPYQEFKVQCVGHSIDPPRAMRLRAQQAFLKHEQKFKYDPEAEIKNAKKRSGRDVPGKTLKDRHEDLARHQFYNTSGNPVNKERNLKVRLDKQRPKDHVITEDEAIAEDTSVGDEEEDVNEK